MKLKYMVISMLIFLFMIPDVHARCSQSDLLRVKSDANSIIIESEFVKDENSNATGKHNIIIKGLTEDLYIQEETIGLYTYDASNNGTITLFNLDGSNYNFKIYYEICDDKLMRTIKYNLPKYNYYAKDPLCEGITKEQLDICGEWYQGELNDDILKQKVEEYKESLKRQQEEEEKNNTIFNQVKKIILDYYIYIIATILVVVIIITIIIFRKKQYSLE